MSKHSLNQVAERYALNEKITVESKFKNKGKKPTKYDYPAAAVACVKKNNAISVKKPTTAINGDAGTPKDWDNKLLSRMNLLLGQLGKKSKLTKCSNDIGRCAEAHAANKVYKSWKTTKTHDLKFSAAIRPRTMLVLNYCDNCKKLFNL